MLRHSTALGQLVVAAGHLPSFSSFVTNLSCFLLVCPCSSVYVRIGAITQSLSSLSDAKKYFDEAYQKHPDYVEGLIVYAMVGG